jgi:DNA-binding LacI/PurR family transcriptional regulator
LTKEDSPDIIFCVNSHIAQRALYLLNKKKIKVPDDVALLAYGFEDFTNLFIPSITCVVQRPEIIGYNATKILLQRLNNKKQDSKKEIIFPPEVFVGSSV